MDDKKEKYIVARKCADGMNAAPRLLDLGFKILDADGTTFCVTLPPGWSRKTILATKSERLTSFSCSQAIKILEVEEKSHVFFFKRLYLIFFDEQ